MIAPFLASIVAVAALPAAEPAHFSGLSQTRFSAAQAAPAASTASDSATLSYADMVDLALDSPVVADATIRSATRIKGAEAAMVPAGTARLYVEADVTALVRGADGLSPRIGYVVDVPLDARGRVPKLRKQRVLLFARPVAGDPSQVQLAAPDAQLPWSPETDARARGVVREVLAADAPPRVTGVGNAFHVPGALPGEGETQVFLQTRDGRPVSLSVLRRPGEQPRFAVALSEIVDDAAAAPRRDTLLWYRLACGLPRTLPETSVGTLSPEDRAAAERDYGFVLSALGPCDRQRART